MAEIHVERKRRSLWWLWLLIILIVAAVIYYLYTNNYFGSDDLNVMNYLRGEITGFSGSHLS